VILLPDGTAIAPIFIDMGASVSVHSPQMPESLGGRPDHTRQKGELIAAAITIAAAICGIFLRWFALGGQSLWFDEGQTEFAARLSPSNLFHFIRTVDHPPLYFLLQHYWGATFGDSEYALRGLAAFFGTLSLPVFYLLAKKLLKDSMAVALAMWLFAFSIMQVWYSREARSYEFISFWALLGLYALIRFLETRSAIAFVLVLLSATVSLYAHNMALFYFLALNVVWLLYPTERSWRQRIGEILIADTIVGAGYLPWVPTLLAQASVDVVHKFFWAPKPTLSMALRTLTLLSGFYPDYLSWVVTRFSRMSAHAAWLCVSGFLGLVCVALLLVGLWRLPKIARARNISLLSYCLVPIILVFILSQLTTPLFIDRVFIASSIVIPIIFAYPLTVRESSRLQLLWRVIAILIAGAASLSAFGYLRYQQKDDWRNASGALIRVHQSNRLIVFIARMGEPLYAYYARTSSDSASVTTMGLPRSFLSSFPPPPGGQIHESDLEQLKRAVESRTYSEIDLVLSYELHDDPNELALAYLDQTYTREDEQKFTGIRILRFIPPGQ
jgi:uncharacterized membrane protein